MEHTDPGLSGRRRSSFRARFRAPVSVNVHAEDFIGMSICGIQGIK
jgi:hypothetical protein